MTRLPRGPARRRTDDRGARSARAALILVVSVGAVLVGPRRADAHDVGLTSIARLFLDDLGAHRYRLVVLDSNVPALGAGHAGLPAGCRPAASSGRAPTSMVFECDRPLAFDDVISLTWPLSGVVVAARWSDGTGGSAYFRGNGRRISVPLGALHAGAASRRRLAASYVLLGAEHILLGPDHLMFVFGLMLLVAGVGELVRTITAFTVAHSITLAAAVLGWIPVDRAPVEAAIALSIVLLAREIVMGGRGRFHLIHRSPWLVAFAFGLLHGLGFAGALGNIGLRSSDIPLALLSFNLGVELGQGAFIVALLAVSYLASGLFRFTAHASAGGGLPAPTRARLPFRVAPARLQPAFGYVLGVVSTVWLFQRIPSVFGW